MNITNAVLTGYIGNDPANEGNIKMDDFLARTNGNKIACPTYIDIHSQGGEMTEAIAIYNRIKYVETDLAIRNVGLIYGAAILPFIAFKKRAATPNANFGFSQAFVYVSAKDDTNQTHTALREMDFFMANAIADNSNLSSPEALQYMKDNRCLDANEALEAGLIHHITDWLDR